MIIYLPLGQFSSAREWQNEVACVHRSDSLPLRSIATETGRSALRSEIRYLFVGFAMRQGRSSVVFTCPRSKCPAFSVPFKAPLIESSSGTVQWYNHGFPVFFFLISFQLSNTSPFCNVSLLQCENCFALIADGMK
jgi:hypothetical protein